MFPIAPSFTIQKSAPPFEGSALSPAALENEYPPKIYPPSGVIAKSIR